MIGLGKAEVVTERATSTFLRGFLDLDDDYTVHLLCENVLSCVF